MLACAAGMTTSLLVEKMKQAAEKNNEEHEIWAIDVDSVKDYLGEFDVLLLGPQVGIRKKSVLNVVGDAAPVDVIVPRYYGLCDGASVLKQAKKLYESAAK